MPRNLKDYGTAVPATWRKPNGFQNRFAASNRNSLPGTDV
jgi:hypothetical protein